MRILYIAADGSETAVEADAGDTIMQAALANGVDGILGECGGSAMCATCHVYIDDAIIEALDPPSEIELEMLPSAAAERRNNSRLACQIVLTPALDGASVRLPEKQL